MRHASMFRAVAAMWLLSGCAALAACSKPKVPDHDDPPEPQAAAVPTPTPTPLREAMQEPLDKADAAQAATEAAAQRQREAIDAATGG